MIRMRLLAVGGLLAAVVGCSGGPTYVSVSGVVTLDGQPYDKAVVSFQPIGDPENNAEPGRGSSAYTDEKGRFVLKHDGRDGALVGKHRVRIMTRGNDVIGQSPEGGTPDDTPTARIDPIPPEWNALSDKEFDVPAGGTDKANFEIKSRKGKGR
jgi:hypothetical protein